MQSIATGCSSSHDAGTPLAVEQLADIVG